MKIIYIILALSTILFSGCSIAEPSKDMRTSNIYPYQDNTYEIGQSGLAYHNVQTYLINGTDNLTTAGFVGTTGEKGEGLRWMGEYDADTTYLKNDLIYMSFMTPSGVYIALLTREGGAPFDDSYFELFASDGEQGEQGDAGFGQGARVYNDANISIADATSTVLTFNSERYDTDSIHHVTDNSSRLTCKTAGKYSIVANLKFYLNATGYRQAGIYLNGTTYIALVRVEYSTAGDVFMPGVATIYDLSVDDYIECRVYQNSGVALNILSVSNYSPEFMMQRIGN